MARYLKRAGRRTFRGFDLKAKDMWEDVVSQIPKELAKAGDKVTQSAPLVGAALRGKILRKAAYLKRVAAPYGAMETRSWKQIGQAMKALGSYNLTSHH